MSQHRKIYQELQQKLQKKNETLNQSASKAKLELLRQQNKTFNFLPRKSRSVKHQLGMLQPQRNKRQKSQPKQYESVPGEISKQMYMTVQFAYHQGGRPVKRYNTHVLHPIGLRATRQKQRNSEVQLKKIKPPRFSLERANILNKSNLFLIPFLKNKIKTINSEMPGGPYVGDIPVNYVYPPKIMLEVIEKRDHDLPKIAPRRNRRKGSIESLKGDIGPW